MKSPGAGAPAPPTEHLSPDEAPRDCTVCARHLSVGERMFYFLEGSGTRPVCRRCMITRDPDGAVIEEQWIRRSSTPPLRERYRRLLDERAQRVQGLAPEIRRYLEEEIDRLDDLVERLPEREPDRPLLEDLVGELRQLLDADRLSEAIVALRDVRRIVSSVEGGRSRVALSAPWDEDVEQLFDRVVARSRAMARSAGTAGDLETRSPDAAPDLRRTRAPS